MGFPTTALAFDMNLLKLFRKKERKPYTPEIQKRPADWSLTLDDLFTEMEAGKRKSIETSEVEWAKEFERNRISEDYRFPQQGDVYQSNINQTISYMTSWSTPFTGGGKATLFKGERIWVNNVPIEKAIGVYTLPIEYEKQERRIISKEERKNPKYGGYYFYIKTITLNNNFTLIQTGFDGKD